MERPIAAVWRIWSQNGQTRKRHAHQLYGGGIKLNRLRFWAINYMPKCKSDTDITMAGVCESVSCEQFALPWRWRERLGVLFTYIL